jgi:acetyl-CoA carboxylase biotin carboxyl carrier protein
MKFQEIQDLIKLIAETGIDQLDLEQPDFKISIVNNKEVKVVERAVQQPLPVQMPPISTAAPAPRNTNSSESEVKGNYKEVKSPIVGTFYRSASPDKPPYIKVGDKVKKGQVVCIVEAMKLFNEIESEISGTVVKVMLEDAQPVEYDQVLFLVEA